jgi:hypothetical protein
MIGLLSQLPSPAVVLGQREQQHFTVTAHMIKMDAL